MLRIPILSLLFYLTFACSSGEDVNSKNRSELNEEQTKEEGFDLAGSNVLRLNEVLNVGEYIQKDDRRMEVLASGLSFTIKRCENLANTDRIESESLELTDHTNDNCHERYRQTGFIVFNAGDLTNENGYNSIKLKETSGRVSLVALNESGEEHTMYEKLIEQRTFSNIRIVINTNGKLVLKYQIGPRGGITKNYRVNFEESPLSYGYN